MGKFEIILILIGIVWTAVSAVAQKKAKAAKLASMEAENPDSTFFVGDEDADFEPVAGEQVDVAIPGDQLNPFQKLREKRLAQLRSRSRPIPPGGVASGTPIRVPPRPPTTLPQEETVDPFQGESIEHMLPIDEHGHEKATSVASLGGNAMSKRLRAVLGDSMQVREAILLNELLSKPLSIRETARF